MAKSPPVSNRLSLAEQDAASEYPTPLAESTRLDCATDLLDERPSRVSALFSNVRPRDIYLPADTSAVMTCDLATHQRSWNEFKRMPLGVKRSTTDYGILVLWLEPEYEQPPKRPAPAGTQSLAQRLGAALKARDTESGLDAIFDAVDTALLAGRFRECNRALASVNVDEWPTDLLVGLLSITLAASDKLSARAAFFERARRALKERGEDTADLLVGLE